MQQRHHEVRTVEAIRHQDAARGQLTEKRPQQGRLAALLALIRPQRQPLDCRRRQRQQHDRPQQRETQARLLGVGLRIGLLVRIGVGQGDREAVHEHDVMAVPAPRVQGLLLQAVADLERQPLQDLRGQLAASAAVVASIQVLQLARQGQGHEGAGQGSSARFDAVEYLGQEGPQRQGRSPEGPGSLAEGHFVVGEGLFDVVGAEDVGEREALSVEKRGEGIMEWRIARSGSRKGHGSLPCQAESSTKEGLPRSYPRQGRPPGKGLAAAGSKKSNSAQRKWHCARAGADGEFAPSAANGGQPALSTLFRHP